MSRRHLGWLIPLVGCATTESTQWMAQTTESGASETYSHRTVPAPTRASRRESVAIGVPLAEENEAPDVETVALSIQRRVPELASERRRLAQTTAVRPQPTCSTDLAGATSSCPSVWPIEVETVWRRYLEDMHGDLAKVPLGELPRKTLMVARVASEVEAEMTERQYGGAPPDIAGGLKRLFRMISLHMAAQAEANGLVAKSSSSELTWPVSPVLITSYYGFRKDPVQEEGDDVRFHRGLDLGGRTGDPVYAAATGRVIHAGRLGGYGLAVILHHENGLETLYGHLSRALVDLGDSVEAASALGLMGQSGRATGPHLHFEVRRDGQPIDPLDVVGVRVGDVALLSGEP